MAQSNVRFKYGICTNRDYEEGKPCPKQVSKEVQKIRNGQDFVCEVCKETLKVVPPPPPIYWKRILPILATIFLLGGIVLGVVTLVKSCSRIGCSIIEREGIVNHPITPDSITLNFNSLTFDSIGASKQLTATIYPDSVQKKNKQVTWQSGDTTVAKVDSNGLVTAVSNGKTEIKVYTGNGFFAICEVIVAGTPTFIPEQLNKASDDKKEKGVNRTVPTPNYGTITFSYGTYTGDLKNGKPHGQGTMYFTKRTQLNTLSTSEYWAEVGDAFNGTWNEGIIAHGKLLDKNKKEKHTILSGQ